MVSTAERAKTKESKATGLTSNGGYGYEKEQTTVRGRNNQSIILTTNNR